MSPALARGQPALDQQRPLEDAAADGRGRHRRAQVRGHVHAESVAEVIQRLEPTIGLEPMTCRSLCALGSLEAAGSPHNQGDP